MKTEISKFLLRLPTSFYLKLKNLARDKDTSLNHLCADLLTVAVKQEGILSKAKIISTIASDIILPAFIEQIIAAYENKISGILLFGSAARGKTWESSDIDLLIIMNKEVDISRSLYQDWDFLLKSQNHFSQKYSPQFVSLPEEVDRIGSIWYEVAQDGIVLFDPSLQASNFLRLVRQEIYSGNVIRRFASGQPYWTKIKSAA